MGTLSQSPNVKANYLLCNEAQGGNRDTGVPDSCHELESLELETAMDQVCVQTAAVGEIHKQCQELLPDLWYSTSVSLNVGTSSHTEHVNYSLCA